MSTKVELYIVRNDRYEYIFTKEADLGFPKILVSQTTLDQWRKVRHKFNKVQDEIKRRVQAQEHKEGPK